MNKLVIPSSPNWYEADIMACAPDNILIYGSRQDLIVITPTPSDQPDDVHIVAKAHAMKITSVNINRNWGAPHKYAVTASEDKIIKLWDIENVEKKISHNAHISIDKSRVVGASFAGDDRIVSASENGAVVIWNLLKNETNVLNTFFSSKATLTCLSICPHVNWLAAFGLKSGLIVVADLRKTGKILYNLRGHSKAIISLAWCPAPVNIFPIKPLNRVTEKHTEVETVQEQYEPSQELACDEAERVSKRKQKTPCKIPVSFTENLFSQDLGEGDFLKECPPLNKEIFRRSAITKSGHDDTQKGSNLQQKSKRETFRVSNILPSRDGVLTLSSPVTTSLMPGESSQSPQKNDTLTNRDIIPMDISHATGKIAPNLMEDGVPGVLDGSPQKNDTPTNRDILPMDISHSTQKIEPKISETSSVSINFRELIDTDDVPVALDESSQKNYTPTNRDVIDMDISYSTQKIESKIPKTPRLMDTSEDLKISASSSSEDRSFSTASSCENELNCSKRQKENLSRSDLDEVFHDASTEKDVENWRTREPEGVDEEPRKEFLLASSAREPNIYIWRAGTDGRMQTFMTVPATKKSQHQKKSSSSQQAERLWITVCWVTPHLLLSSSRTAELLQWTLPKPLNQAKFFHVVHKDHWSVLFSIKAPIVYRNEYNFLQKDNVNVWTTGMDRMIINTDLRTMKNLACLPALGSSVNCMAASPLDPNRLAIGTGEGLINTWDLSRAHKKSIVFGSFYQKILSAVTALAWHPTNESSLAFGTDEGRVGVVEVTNKSKQPKILPHFFKTQVFKLEWGPLDTQADKQKLFVVGEGKVAIFDLKSKEKDPEMLELPDNTDVYTMAWKPNYSMLLVASKTRTLITYSPDLRILNILYINQNLQSILWHPDAASDTLGSLCVSKYCDTFVSIIKHNELVVFDLNVQSQNCEDMVVATFENRGVKIGEVAWSPHCGKHLVVVDDGGIAQVYDIETKTRIATYVNPCLDHLLAVYWSPVDPDYIIVGTGLQKIIVWQVSQHIALSDTEINTQKNRIIKAQQKEATKEKKSPQLTEKCEGEIVMTKTQRKSQLVPLFYSVRDTSAVEDIRKLLQWKLGNREGEVNAGNTNRLDVLDVFGDENNLQRVFQLNLSSFKQQGKYQQRNVLKLLQGDISTAIKEAIEQKRVNPWIISMCPMVSPKLWQTACETYVQQLLEEPEADPLEVVTYLLACHKIEDCVKFLCEQQMFREALLLAKARFGQDNPMVSDVWEKFAKQSTYQGNFELAACCYIILGKFEEAASVLFRRSNVEFLEVAAELAELSGNEELHKAVVFRLNAFKPESSEVAPNAAVNSTGTEGAKLEPMIVETTQEEMESEIINSVVESPKDTSDIKEDSRISQAETPNVVGVKIIIEEIGHNNPGEKAVIEMKSESDISKTCEQSDVTQCPEDTSNIKEDSPITQAETPNVVGVETIVKELGHVEMESESRKNISKTCEQSDVTQSPDDTSNIEEDSPISQAETPNVVGVEMIVKELGHVEMESKSHKDISKTCDQSDVTQSPEDTSNIEEDTPISQAETPNVVGAETMVKELGHVEMESESRKDISKTCDQSDVTQSPDDTSNIEEDSPISQAETPNVVGVETIVKELGHVEMESESRKDISKTCKQSDVTQPPEDTSNIEEDSPISQAETPNVVGVETMVKELEHVERESESRKDISKTCEQSDVTQSPEDTSNIEEE